MTTFIGKMEFLVISSCFPQKFQYNYLGITVQLNPFRNNHHNYICESQRIILPKVNRLFTLLNHKEQGRNETNNRIHLFLHKAYNENVTFG
jgi:hypothetical protein